MLHLGKGSRFGCGEFVEKRASWQLILPGVRPARTSGIAVAMQDTAVGERQKLDERPELN